MITLNHFYCFVLSEDLDVNWRQTRDSDLHRTKFTSCVQIPNDLYIQTSKDCSRCILCTYICIRERAVIYFSFIRLVTEPGLIWNLIHFVGRTIVHWWLKATLWRFVSILFGEEGASECSVSNHNDQLLFCSRRVWDIISKSLWNWHAAVQL